MTNATPPTDPPEKTPAEDPGDRAHRVMSMQKAARLLGCDRGTLTAWRWMGMPVEDEGGTGKPTLVDLKRVVAWRENQIRVEERAKYAKPDEADDLTGKPLTTAERLQERRIRQADQKMAILAKILVHREPLQMAIRQANGLARQTVMSIPEMLVRKLGSAVSKEKVAELHQEAWTLCAAALTSWATEVNLAMRAAAEQTVDLQDDEDEDDDATE